MHKDNRTFNPHLSVDCVVFGFDGQNLKVLLIEQVYDQAGRTGKFKLPGDLIIEQEDLDDATKRVLHELTGLSDIFLTQFGVFGHPKRISDPKDLDWLESASGAKITRVVTTAYLSLIKLDSTKHENVVNAKASWHRVQSLPRLAFDHEEIVHAGLRALKQKLKFEPVVFELLPGKFTIRQIQNVYECILGQKLDNRNFRKKLLKAPYLEAMNEKQDGVAHKPARYYCFNKEKYQDTKNDSLLYNF